MKISKNKICTRCGSLQKCFFFKCSSPMFVQRFCMQSSYFVLLSKKINFFLEFLTKKVSIQGTLQTVSISILYLLICSYLLHIAQLQPKRVPQLRQCYKLHMPWVQRCHQWPLSPFCPHHWLQQYFHCYTITIKNMSM